MATLKELAEDPRNAGAAIRADYRAWFAKAAEYVCRHRGDALIEGAPGGAEEFLASALPFTADGYAVELVVLAVREADSLLSTALRYARSLHDSLATSSFIRLAAPHWSAMSGSEKS